MEWKVDRRRGLKELLRVPIGVESGQEERTKGVTKVTDWSGKWTGGED